MRSAEWRRAEAAAWSRLLRAIGAAALAVLCGWSVVAAAADNFSARLPACLACHGEKGQSATPAVPSLGGQQPFYLTVQLLMFREKMRVVEVMNQAAQGLTDADLRGFAEFFAKQPPPQPVAGPTAEDRILRARALAEQARCNFCHNRDYSGDQNVPRVAAQREDYLVKTLREYKSNARRGYDAAMADVVQPLSDEQIQDLAYYLARFR